MTGRSTINAASDQVSCDLAGDTAILHLKSGMYYSLNRLGSYIWNIIQNPTRIEDIQRRMLDEYDVATGRCETDLLALLDDLAAAGLIEVHDEPRP